MTFPTKNVPKNDRDVAGRVWQWMVRNADSYDNATAIAEDAAYQADGDHDDWLDDPDHWIWELAIEAVPGE